MLESMIAGALALAVSAGQVADAPDRLISGHGIEISNDGRVFVLFAALNGLGYSAEKKRKGPPLEAPVYHPIRAQARDGLRKLTAAGRLGPLRKFFDEHPATIDVYLATILCRGLSLNEATCTEPPDATKVSGAVEHLKTLGQDEELTRLFDAIAMQQRRLAKTLLGALERDFVEAEKYLALDDLRPPRELVVIPNPLDAHGYVRNVKLDTGHYLVVGPGVNATRQAVLLASLRPLVAQWVEAGWEGARLLKKHWEGLKLSKRITERFPQGQQYAAETLSRVLAYRIHAMVDGRDPAAEEEDFIDAESKDGMRWTRAMLRALDTVKAGEPVADTFPKLLSRANP